MILRIKLPMILCLILLSRLWPAGITLNKIPLGFNREESEIEVTWQESLSGRLKFGVNPGSYTQESIATGIGRLIFRPQDEGMKSGVYYAIVASGAWTSQEFRIIVESATAPLMKSPANNAAITTSTPVFSWEPVAGVPYYHIFLSDQEVILSRDANDELQLQGGDILWQAITSATSIAYGTQDPSGYFLVGTETPPPVMNGFVYNWIVLNNYGNHPALSSTVQAGVSAFKAQITSSVAAPQLLTPSRSAMISESAVTFSWNVVQGVSAYQLLLSETKIQEGSESSFLIWQPITTEANLTMPARLLLRGGKYIWKVLSLDDKGGGVASETRSFTYQAPLAQITVSSLNHRLQSLPRVEVEVKPQSGSTEILHLLTSDHGRLVIDVQPGVYQIVGHKEGFADSSIRVSVMAGENKNASLILREWQQSVSGEVINQNKQAVAGARITFRHSSTDLTGTTLTDAGGRFSQKLASGTWMLSAEKTGFRSATPQTFSLSEGQTLNLDKALELVDQSGQIVGRVLTDNGLALQNARVVLSKEASEYSSFTDAGGNFTMMLSEGTWQIFAEKTGYLRSPSRTVQVKAGATFTLQPDLILFSHAGLVSGFVLTADRVVADALVIDTPLVGAGTCTRSSAKGAFTFSLAAGIHRVSVLQKGYLLDHDLLVQIANAQTISNIQLLLRPAEVQISGRVTSGGSDLANAVVRSENSSDTTAADGSFHLFEAPGTHFVLAEKRGYVPTEIKLNDLKAGEIKTNINVALLADAGIIEGQVLANGQPVAGADLTANYGTSVFRTSSALDGRYTLNLPAGLWSLSCDKTGFYQQNKSGLALNAKQILAGVGVNLTQTKSMIQGQVTDAKNRALQNALLQVTGTHLFAASDSRGEYTLPAHPGDVEITAQKTGYAPKTARVILNEGSTQILHFKLQTMGLVRGFVQDLQAKPLQNVLLKIKDSLATKTDYAGEYFLYFSPGTYKLNVDKLGFAALEFSFTLQGQDTLRKNFSLTPDLSEIAIISGQIRNSLGQAVQGVGMQLAGAEVRLLYSDELGNFSTGELAAGLKYALQPLSSGRFFVPAQRTFDPLPANASGQNFLRAQYGDVSANEQISSFDGSLILRIKAEQDVSPYYRSQPRDSIAADVSANHEISPFDASLIFRYAAGLLSEFPAQKPALTKMQLTEYSQRKLTLTGLQTPGQTVYTLNLDQVEDVWAGTFNFSYDETVLKLSRIETDDASLATYRDQGDRLAVFWVRLQPMRPYDLVLKLMFDSYSRFTLEESCLLIKANLNEGQIPVSLAGLDAELFIVHGNYPNPFNAMTTFRYVLGGESGTPRPVRIEIYNILGERIITLLDRPQPPGFHQVQWNGLDHHQRRLASGVYFCTLTAGTRTETVKLLLIR